MDRQPAGLSFAAIGHQDSWEKVTRFVNSIRGLGDMASLSLQQIRDVYGFIPPRTIFEVNMQSATAGNCKGVYIETFIAPDELDAKHLRRNLQKVKEACAYAAALRIPVVSLGGFTSIILESAGQELSRIADTFFTTGNTLTAAFIAKGVEQACVHWGQPLRTSNMLIIGATGDIGSACTRYFSGKVKKLLLCARQQGRLAALTETTGRQGIPVASSTDITALLPQADVVICVASSILGQQGFAGLPEHAIICDAGYPKNLSREAMRAGMRLFAGGIGIVERGFFFEPDHRNDVYHFPVANAVHGCLLEAIVLAMEGRASAFSTGRGNIEVEAMEEIVQMAARHGVYPAPLFGEGPILHPDIKTEQHEPA